MATQATDFDSGRKLSIDPSVRLKIEKLEVALKYLGLEPNDDQQTELRRRLDVDKDETVRYGDFVRLAREIFKQQLDYVTLTRSMSRPTSTDANQLQPAAILQFTQQSDAAVELEMIRAERNKLLADLEATKTSVQQKDCELRSTEDELLRVRKEAQLSIAETRSLRTRVQLAEKAHRAARDMEDDYEEVIRVLELELSHQRAALDNRLAPNNNSPSGQKKVSLLGCQLRKAEVCRKTYEVAAERLLQFAEVVFETCCADTISNNRSESIKTVVPHALPPHVVQTLASEARDIIKAVKSLLEVEALPFGWEEVYTSDGLRYYINHVTQTSSWQHPLSKVEHHVATTTASTPATSSAHNPGSTLPGATLNKHS